ncbi:hypothetical protein SAMN04489726_4809 [Allokutzneria albata]|uniref:Uncharacterized protein n=1 Tax=Allokutzneria albata TaxID=211114 RepID=A0A1G9YHV1_ALLAB|nr:hypothetical protein SAMN04489726_4809 [Allokutzneria albata]
MSLVVVLVAGLGIGGWALFGSGGGGAAPGGSQAAGGKGKELTEADVAKVDPAKLLDDTLTAQLTQPVVHTRIDSIVFQAKAYLSGGPYEGKIVEGGFDYRQRKLNFMDDFSACIDGNEIRRRSSGVVANYGPCPPVKSSTVGSKVGNGLLPGGLNETQAQAFLAYLHKAEGFLNPGKPTMVSREGKQYIRFPVAFKTVETSVGPAGGQMFTWAFKDTKLSFDDHPYTPMSGTQNTTEVLFYLDPKSLLPVYSEQFDYHPKDDPNGLEGTIRRVEYLWDGQIPMPDQEQIGKPKGPSWPSERLKPGQLK